MRSPVRSQPWASSTVPIWKTPPSLSDAPIPKEPSLTGKASATPDLNTGNLRRTRRIPPRKRKPGRKQAATRLIPVKTAILMKGKIPKNPAETSQERMSPETARTAGIPVTTSPATRNRGMRSRIRMSPGTTIPEMKNLTTNPAAKNRETMNPERKNLTTNPAVRIPERKSLRRNPTFRKKRRFFPSPPWSLCRTKSKAFPATTWSGRWAIMSWLTIPPEAREMSASRLSR